MQKNKFEKLVKIVYRAWKSARAGSIDAHPDEQELSCFLESKLSPEEQERIKAHLLDCSTCSDYLATHLKLKSAEELSVPLELVLNAKNILQQDNPEVLEIILRLKDRLFEIVNTTGDILVGQEFVPASLLRSRQIKDFKDEVIILKDFRDVRIEIKVESRQEQLFNLTVLAKDRQTQAVIKDLRIALIKDDLELESYISDSGSVVFEHVILGEYRVDISRSEGKFASVFFNIKK